MAKNFNEKLIELLKNDSRFVDDEGELVKAAVIDRAWKIDRDLVKLLLGKPEIKGKFFDEIEGHWIFNINTFIEYVADKNFLANSYTRFRNKIGLNIDGKFLRERGEVSLVWPYKDCVLEGGQTKEEEKRKEIFFNEILAQDEIDRLFDPKALTNWKRYTVDGEQKVTEIKRDETGTIRENLIIKGNNLLALHTLKKQFRGKVKLIYIDPPYNTGGDSFGYNDNFNHSTWLTFMRNRLEVSRELLKDDGIIFVQCDDNEQAYLKVLLDDIFERSNYVSSIVIKSSTPSGVKTAHRTKTIIKQKDTVLVFRKSSSASFNPQYAARERWDKHFGIYLDRVNDQIISLAKVLKDKGILNEDQSIDDFDISNPKHKKFYIENSANICQSKSHNNSEAQKASLSKPDSVIYFNKGTNNESIYLNGRQLTPLATSINDVIIGNIETKAFSFLLCDFWSDIDFNNTQNEGGISFPAGKKPELLLYRLIKLASNEGDIVLDYHIGSGTTCAVAHKMKRQYIGIEQLDYGHNDSTIRLQNVIGKKIKEKGEMFDKLQFDQSGISKAINWQGGGDFIYGELMKYNEAFMDNIQAAKTSKELVNLWKGIAENSFLNWYVNPEMPEEAINDYIAIGKTENGLDKQKKLLAELLNKNQLYVNLSEIDDADFNVSDGDKKLNQSFYGGNA
ncbi:MAG: site-specific DNA-methyltransferase [Desulfofustis sp. PB-SRB1]|jgi:adenine-specific DNA-methyltransferase|nr:site-specific DNA-methyltransferase [Desulfofustis sp. PB-SRB1]